MMLAVLLQAKTATSPTFPTWTNLEFREDADYVYICENETIYGTHYR